MSAPQESDGLLESIEELVQGFVDEYLERTPDYGDVVEFVQENIADEDAIDDELLAKVFKGVVADLDTIAQRYGDER